MAKKSMSQFEWGRNISKVFQVSSGYTAILMYIFNYLHKIIYMTVHKRVCERFVEVSSKVGDVLLWVN